MERTFGEMLAAKLLLTPKTSPPDLLFEEEEHTTMKAPLRRGVWGDVRNSKCLSNLRMNGKNIWGDVSNDFLTQTQKTSSPDLLFEEEEQKKPSWKAHLRRC